MYCSDLKYCLLNVFLGGWARKSINLTIWIMTRVRLTFALYFLEIYTSPDLISMTFTRKLTIIIYFNYFFIRLPKFDKLNMYQSVTYNVSLIIMQIMIYWYLPCQRKKKDFHATIIFNNNLFLVISAVAIVAKYY